jgi:alkaline phosphatase D
MPKILLFAYCLLLCPVAIMAQAYQSQLAPFYHGVASGDPLADRVILWTRVTPPTGSTPDSIAVCWQVATDTAFSNMVLWGNANALATKDYTLKIDAIGLEAATHYYYRFFAYDKYSLIGRTKTAASGATDHLRFAVVSCANYSGGYFLAYERLVNRNDIDAVIHLGDYIYEYSSSSILGGVRPHQPDVEILSLSDYRTRYSQYRRDPDLMRLHQQFPMIAVWDDHETCNNSWYGGADNHEPATEGDWFVRKANGIQAYVEWMPIRQPEPISDPQRIFRKISYGNLLDLFMLDTRLYGRDEQDGTSNNDPNRSILGASQYNWLASELSNSTAQWKILGQQVMIAPMKLAGIPVNSDQWDGYPAERQKLYNHIMNNNIQNIVVVTGDIHSSWANDLPYNSSYNDNTGANSVGVEFVTASVTTANFPFPIGENLLELSNNHVKYLDLTAHGYILLDITPARTQADWYHTPEPTTQNYTATRDASFYVNAGERFLRSTSNGAAPIATHDLAPAAPPSTGMELQLRVLLQGAYFASTDQMHNILRNNNLLPTEQPFDRSPWNYNGTEIINDLNNIPNSITDWILVELRQVGDSSLIEQKAGLLHSNGLISDSDGLLNGISFANAKPCTDYWVAIRPRNHLAVLSSNPITAPYALYDFTTAQTQAAGTAQQILVNGKYMLYAGDCNANGIINYSDYNLYKAYEGQNNNYLPADLNLNGNTDNNDFYLLRPNTHLIGIPILRY